MFQEPQKSEGKLQRATTNGQEVASEAETMSHHCNGCGKPEHNQNFLQCKQCKSVRYCSYQCQQKRWNTHEELCKAIYELSKQSQPKGKSDSEDNKVYVSHLTPSQQSKVVPLVGKRCTVDCLLNEKQVEALWDTGAQCSIIPNSLVNSLFEKPYIWPISGLLDDSDYLKLTAANWSAIPYDGCIEVELSLMSDETSKKIQVPLLVTSDSLDCPIIGYNVIDEFVTQQSNCNDPVIQSFKNTQPENVHALINFIQTPKQTDLCDVKTSKRDVTTPKKQSMKLSCRVNTGPLEQKVPVLLEPSELEQWPAGLEVPEMLLSLKQGNNSIVHVKVFSFTDHDIVLRNRTEIGHLQLVRSVYPIEVKPADNKEADSQDQEDDVTSGESRNK